MKLTLKGSQISKSMLLVAFAILAICIRLMLGADRDILAVNQPYDDYWFVSKALHWGGNYTHMVIAQLPTYAIWLKGSSLLGIPARLAIDIAWLASVAYLGFSVTQLLRSVWPGIAIFIFLAFHPFSFVLFDNALSENLLTVLSAVALAGFIELWNLRDAPRIRDWRHISAWCATALAFAAAYHTRKEGIVLLTALFLLAILSAFKRDLFWQGERKYRLGYPLLVAPVAATLIFGVILAGANYARWGVFARYDLAASGYTRAINVLNAIDPGGPTPKHVTVTALTREKAYAQSSTFAELKPYLDGPMGQGVAKLTEQYGAPGEIANGWFYWTIRDAAAAAGWHVNTHIAERKYNAMAQELEAAIESGRLQRRWVILPFVDPDWAKWLPDLPAAFAGELRQLVDPALMRVPAENASAEQYDRYVELVGRRSPLPRTTIAGWMTLPEGTRIGLGSNDRVYSWQILEGAARSDLPGAIPFRLSSVCGDSPTEFWVQPPAGIKAHISLSNLRQGFVQPIPDIQNAFIGVDQLANTLKKHKVDSFIGPMSIAWSWLGWVLIAAGFVALWPLRLELRKSRQKAVSIVTALLLVAILSRVVLIALLDASSWPGQQARYLLPVVPFFAVFGILGIWAVLQLIKQMHPNRTIE